MRRPEGGIRLRGWNQSRPWRAIGKQVRIEVRGQSPGDGRIQRRAQQQEHAEFCDQPPLHNAVMLSTTPRGRILTVSRPPRTFDWMMTIAFDAYALEGL